MPFDPIKLLTGMTGTELKLQGQQNYPQENDPLNRTAHREGARRLTDRYGVLGAQGLGVGNELMEALQRKLAGSESPMIGWGESGEDPLMDIGDIGANVRGSMDSRLPGWEAIIRALQERFKGQ